MESDEQMEVRESVAEPVVDEPVANEVVDEPITPVAKPKKILSEARLKKLEKARERASQVARERRESKNKPQEPEPVVVVEQSDSDPDEFQGPPGGLFVRRKRNKPKSDEMRMNMLYAQMFGMPRNL